MYKQLITVTPNAACAPKKLRKLINGFCCGSFFLLSLQYDFHYNYFFLTLVNSFQDISHDQNPQSLRHLTDLFHLVSAKKNQTDSEFTNVKEMLLKIES